MKRDRLFQLEGELCIVAWCRVSNGGISGRVISAPRWPRPQQLFVLDEDRQESSARSTGRAGQPKYLRACHLVYRGERRLWHHSHLPSLHLCANELLLAQRYGLHRGRLTISSRRSLSASADEESEFQIPGWSGNDCSRKYLAPILPMANRSASASVLSADAVARKETH